VRVRESERESRFAAKEREVHARVKQHTTSERKYKGDQKGRIGEP
jgi:hypothetical protein